MAFGAVMRDAIGGLIGALIGDCLTSLYSLIPASGAIIGAGIRGRH